MINAVEITLIPLLSSLEARSQHPPVSKFLDCSLELKTLALQIKSDYITYTVQRRSRGREAWIDRSRTGDSLTIGAIDSCRCGFGCYCVKKKPPKKELHDDVNSIGGGDAMSAERTKSCLALAIKCALYRR